MIESRVMTMRSYLHARGNHDIVGDDAVGEPDVIADSDPIPQHGVRDLRARRDARCGAQVERPLFVGGEAPRGIEVIRGSADVVERARRWNDADRAGIAGRQCRIDVAQHLGGSRRIDARERGRVHGLHAYEVPAARRGRNAGWRGAAWHDADEASEAIGQQGVVLLQVRRSHGERGECSRLRVRVGQAGRSTSASVSPLTIEEAVGGEQGQRAGRASARAEDLRFPTNSAPRSRAARRRRPPA